MVLDLVYTTRMQETVKKNTCISMESSANRKRLSTIGALVGVFQFVHGHDTMKV